MPESGIAGGDSHLIIPMAGPSHDWKAGAADQDPVSKFTLINGTGLATAWTKLERSGDKIVFDSGVAPGGGYRQYLEILLPVPLALHDWVFQFTTDLDTYTVDGSHLWVDLFDAPHGVGTENGLRTGTYRSGGNALESSLYFANAQTSAHNTRVEASWASVMKTVVHWAGETMFQEVWVGAAATAVGPADLTTPGPMTFDPTRLSTSLKIDFSVSAGGQLAGSIYNIAVGW